MYDAGGYFTMSPAEDNGWKVVVSAEDGLMKDDSSAYVTCLDYQISLPQGNYKLSPINPVTVQLEIFTRRKSLPILSSAVIGENFFCESFLLC